MDDPTKPTLNDNGIFILSGKFDNVMAEKVITWILEHNLRVKKLSELKLIINSRGGEVDAAFAIIDTICGSPIPITTIGIGCVASCGILTLMAGDHRILTPNTSVLTHQWSGGSYGKEHELVASMKSQDMTQTKFVNHYKKYTGLSEKVIREKLLPPSDVWLTAKEAKAFNLCDEIRLI